MVFNAVQPRLFDNKESRFVGYVRGHKTYADPEDPDRLVYEDGSTVDYSNLRSCAACKQDPTPEGHDPCIARIPGALGACCGHGHPAGAYVAFHAGGAFYGDVAVKYFEELKS